MNEWGPWGTCSKSCGGGIQTRTRTTKTPPSYGGQACLPSSDSQPCATNACAGCSPGFWKNHLDQWRPQNNLGFDALFGINYIPNGDLRIAEAISLNGEPFVFHAIAAYLNSIYLPGFPYTTAQVITIVQNGFNSGTTQQAQNFLSSANSLNCPLGGKANTTLPPYP